MRTETPPPRGRARDARRPGDGASCIAALVGPTVHALLAFEGVGVPAIGRVQLFMGADGLDPALVQHHDLVGARHGGETMGHNDDGHAGPFPHTGEDAAAGGLRLRLRAAARLGGGPEGGRGASINGDAVAGGQAGQEQQSACVADRCVATFDRRFIAEESYDEVRAEVVAIVRQLEAEQPGRRYTIEDRMVVNPVQTPDGSPVVAALSRAVARVRGSEASLVGSPGTYDHKHFARIAGVEHCVAYGPGPLEEAHQPDESCSIDDLVASSQVMALAALELVGC